MLILLFVAVAGLAYANGANDNWKGVATLHGSGTLGYRAALALATVATALGGLVAIVLATDLLRRFSGAGLVPADIIGTPAFAAAVAVGGAVTIGLATRLGMPTSTTHALTGALLGIVVTGSGAAGAGGVLWTGFLRPLLVAPLLAVSITAGLWLLATRMRRTLAVQPDSCVCVDLPVAPLRPALQPAPAELQRQSAPLAAPLAASECAPAAGRLRLTAGRALDGVHVLSGASVCFARGVNDAPKIAALGVVTGGFGNWSLPIVAAAMVAGGLLGSRGVAHTMSHRLVPLNPGQGATGNLVTAGLVLGASQFGLPVSTTHVSCGAIFGIGLATRSADVRVIRNVLLTWLCTLPLGAVLGGACYAVLA
jgi:inorganic phosphate transporter, PiT family